MKVKNTINIFSLPPLMSFEYEGDMDKIAEVISSIDYHESPGNIKSDERYVLENPELFELKKFWKLSFLELILATTIFKFLQVFFNPIKETYKFSL